MTALLHQLSQWYLSQLGSGGYWLIAALMALESTLLPIPSEIIVPPAAYLAANGGPLGVPGIILAGTAGSWLGATIMYWGTRWLGRPLVLRYGPYVGLAAAKIELAEAWAAHYGWAGVFFARLLPVIRHLIGIPAGIVRLDFRWYSVATLLGSLLWVSVLAYLGVLVGNNAALLTGSLHRFALLVLGVALVLGGLYYFFVRRVARR